ncbi:hypothetical protein RR42_s1880 [Cupriavidus basilensis]|uniref:Uncharacterized protein n=1 Tax=Cupriavidus basilensis TaxID=68895 RepID=A0A0C4YK71_9BURK|nr:hypothetical protein RR42_s1880 [Cupriavidus basilensis]
MHGGSHCFKAHFALTREPGYRLPDGMFHVIHLRHGTQQSLYLKLHDSQ